MTVSARHFTLRREEEEKAILMDVLETRVNDRVLREGEKCDKCKDV